MIHLKNINITAHINKCSHPLKEFKTLVIEFELPFSAPFTKRCGLDT